MRLDSRLWIVGGLALLVLYLARTALAPFILAAIIAYVFTPPVDAIAERSRLPRGAVVALLYALVLGLVVVLVLVGERPLVRETRGLIRSGPLIIYDLLAQTFGGDRILVFGQPVTVVEIVDGIQAAIQDSLGQPNQALRLAEALVNGVVSVLLCLIATFYLLLDGRRIGGYLVRFIPAERREEVGRVAHQIHLVLGRFLRGQLLLIALMATLTYVGLTAIFHLRYSLPIAIASGLLEVIPFIGPVIAGTLAATVGFAQGGFGMVLGIVALYFVLRQLEDQLVMPQVVGRAVHIHPLVTIFAVVVGETIAGVLGMLVAVPVTAAAKVVLDHVFPPVSPAAESVSQDESPGPNEAGGPVEATETAETTETSETTGKKSRPAQSPLGR